MPPESFERKLAAILSADVAGYSRLMGEDDDATARTLTGYSLPRRPALSHPMYPSEIVSPGPFPVALR
jgi:hypothetical protein